MNHKVPNVQLRYEKRKNGKSYFLDIHINGERLKERLGFINLNQANQARAKKINELLNHKGISTKRSKISLEQAIDLHLQSKKGDLRKKTKSTYKSYKVHIVESIREVGEKYFRDITAISEAQFQLLVDSVKKRSKSDHRRNNLIVFLKAVENTAINRGYLDKKISYNIKTRKPDPKLNVQYFKYEEMQKIWSLIDDFYVDYYKFMVFTGLRLGEFINLRWDNIDLENKKMAIEKYIIAGEVIWEPKTKSSIRNVPLNDEAQEILRNQIGKNAIYVFTSIVGEKLHPNTVYANFKKAVKQVEGSEHKTVHTLRHTFASSLAQEKNDLYRIASYMGHSSAETTRLYAHLCPSNDSEVLNAIKA